MSTASTPAVAVRQRRQRRAGGEGLCGRPALRPGVQPDWCGTHYAAAAFAVVVRRHAELRHRHQRGQAGHARRAAVVQFRLLPQPARRFDGGKQRFVRPFVLGAQPAQVTARGGSACVAVAEPGGEQSFGGKQRHLCVVGNGAGVVVAGGKGGDARLAKPAQDIGAAHEFDRCAEGIACGTAEQAAAEAVDDGDGMAHGFFCCLLS